MQRAGSVWERCRSLCATTRALADKELSEMPATELLTEAEAIGIRLTVEGEHLCIRGPHAAQPLGRLLLKRKVAVLAVLGTAGQGAGEAASPTNPTVTSSASAAAETMLWDAEKASAVVAEVDAWIDAALHDNIVTNNAARRNVLANERIIVRRLARDHDPFLWQWPRAFEHLLQRWAEWDAACAL